jgi:hypothetical protein
MKHLFTLCLLPLFSFCYCSNGTTNETLRKEPSVQQASTADPANSHWKGSFSNGMKGAKLSFDVKKGEVKDLTFQGYWRCDGKLELTTLGPKKGFAIKGNSVDGIIKEEGFYFELHGNFTGNKASGTLRFAFVAGGCDTYKLNWTAEKE